MIEGQLACRGNDGIYKSSFIKHYSNIRKVYLYTLKVNPQKNPFQLQMAKQ